MSILERFYGSLLVEADPTPAPIEAIYRALLGSTTLGGKRGRDDLRIYQTRVIDIMKGIWTDPTSPPGAIIALEPGAGKTVSTLTVILDLLRAAMVKKPLIIAPLLVAETVWDAEVEEWAHLEGMTCSKILGTEKQRIAALSADTDFYIMNRENVPWLWKHLGRGKNWPFDMLVIDEASMLKNGKKRTMKKALTRFGAIAAARKFFSGVIELTGTPAPNGLKNLWGLSYIVDQGERLGRTKGDFESRWFNTNKYTYETTPKPHAEKEILDRMKDIMFSLNPDDYASLPPLIENDIEVVLPPETMAEYKRFKRTLVSEKYDVEAVNAAVLTNKLLQFCIAEDTEVLTRRGWVAIQHISQTDVVWDGCEWVTQNGCVFMGLKPVIECFSVKMTPDHKVLTEAGWREAREVVCDGNASGGIDRAPVRLPSSVVATWVDRWSVEEGHMDVSMRLWKSRRPHQSESSPCRKASTDCDAELRLQAWRDCACGEGWPWHDQHPPMGHLAADAPSVPEHRSSGLSQLWRSRNRHAGLVVRVVRRLLGGCSARLRGRSHLRSSVQRERLLERELPMGDNEGSDAQYSREPADRHTLGRDDACGGRRSSRAQVCDVVAAASEGLAGTPSLRRPGAVAVYDLVNCGPRHRFVVRGNDGQPLIVHNCNGSLYNEDGDDVWVHDHKLNALVDLHDEMNGTPMLVAYSFKFDLDRIRRKFPKAVVLNEEKDATEVVRRWNRGEIDMLLAHPASAGHGLNLQKGSNVSVWYGLNADLELFQQFNKRLWRSGQQAEVVWSHRIIARATHDENILPILSKKDSIQSQVLRATYIELTD